MSSITNIQLSTTLSAAQLKSVINFFGGKHNYAVSLGDFIRGNSGGVYTGTYLNNVGAVQSIGKVIFTGPPTTGSSLSLGNVTLTAQTTGSTTAQFTIGSTVTITAANLAATIGSNTTTNAFVSATSSAGTVTITSITAGAVGNTIQLSTNTGSSSIVAFTGGTNGTSRTYTF